MQVLRGPNTTAAGMPSPASVMGAHSLLETMYGNGSIHGDDLASTNPGPPPFPQLLNLTTSLSLAQVAHCGGCVLTITGPTTTTTEYGQSTRIVGGNLSSTPPIIQVMAFSDGQVPPAGATFLINGVPFSGTGFGYNVATGNLNMTTTITTAAGPLTCPLALLPNDTTQNRNPPGGANTDYTAPDFQHMVLAAQVPTTATPPVIQTLPSMHRPALCRYWASQPGVIASPPDFTTAGGLCLRRSSH